MRAKTTARLHIASPRLNELNILDCLVADPKITQAEIGRRCGLSVAMVNNYMKELCSAGLLEYHRKSTKSVTYHVTLAGTLQIRALEQEFLDDMVSLFNEALRRIGALIAAQSKAPLQRVVLYGLGDPAVLVFHALEARNIQIVGVCDDDPARIGREWHGREVSNPSQIRYMAPDAVILCDRNRSDEMYRGLRYLQDRGIALIRLDGRAAPASAQPMLLAGSGVPHAGEAPSRNTASRTGG